MPTTLTLIEEVINVDTSWTGSVMCLEDVLCANIFLSPGLGTKFVLFPFGVDFLGQCDLFDHSLC